jgi:hypothetical protein
MKWSINFFSLNLNLNIQSTNNHRHMNILRQKKPIDEERKLFSSDLENIKAE